MPRRKVRGIKAAAWRRKMRRAGVSFCVALIGLTAGGACGLVSGDDAKVSVSFYIARPNVNLENLNARLVTPDWSRTITRANFTRTDAPNFTPEYDTPTRG